MDCCIKPSLSFLAKNTPSISTALLWEAAFSLQENRLSRGKKNSVWPRLWATSGELCFDLPPPLTSTRIYNQGSKRRAQLVMRSALSVYLSFIHFAFATVQSLEAQSDGFSKATEILNLQIIPFTLQPFPFPLLVHPCKPFSQCWKKKKKRRQIGQCRASLPSVQ